MAEREGEKRAPRATLWVGPGRRSREIGAVLATLSALGGEGERRAEPLPLAELGDLEELLAPRTAEGLLVLESIRVPGEDIGFVRRFLERHPLWRLVLVGEEPKDGARALPAARVAWLAWPPDLEELRALLGGAPVATQERRGPVRRAGRGAPADAASGADDGAVDVARLLEELLTSAALRKEGAPRFAFQESAAPPVHRRRAALTEGLAGLIELARGSAGTEGLVRLRVGPAPEGVVVDVDFPAPVRAKELATLLSDGSEVAPELRATVAAARAGAEHLLGAGARVELEASEGARARLRVVFVERTVPPPPARPARPVKAEDPFA